jgi:hypothetical protein
LSVLHLASMGKDKGIPKGREVQQQEVSRFSGDRCCI